MASPFIPIDRNCPIELPASLEGWLREDHLARFIVDVVEQLEGKSQRSLNTFLTST